MARKDNGEAVDEIAEYREQLAEAIGVLWIQFRQGEALFLDEFERILSEVRVNSEEWAGRQAMFDISPQTWENGVSTWQRSDRYVRDTWAALQCQFKATENPIGVLNFAPRVLRGNTARVEQVHQKVPGFCGPIEKAFRAL